MFFQLKIQYNSKSNVLYCCCGLERHMSRPYIRKDQLMNQTAIIHGNVTFKCLVVPDIATFITWAKYFAPPNDNDIDDNLVKRLNKIRIKVQFTIR